jgi:hypothetical protein
LINRCAAQVKIKITISPHGRHDWLCFIHAKLFEYVTTILRLTNEGSLFGLLDLKSNKECENPNHEHLKSIRHYFAKYITKEFVSRTKYNIINIDLAYNQIFTHFLVKRVESALPILKPFSIRKSLRHSYHAFGACLSLYSTLLSL